VRRHLNPRIVTADMLRAMRADLTLALARWNVKRMMPIPAAERTDSAALVQRPRKPWEWPEFRADDWQVLDRELGEVAAQVAELRSYAAEQIRRLHCLAGCGRRLTASEAMAGIVRCAHCPDPSDPLYVPATALAPNDPRHNRKD
jgi:hypothetical protein